jgi:hypothetical protein
MSASKFLYEEAYPERAKARCQQIDPAKFKERNAAKDAAGF